MSIDKKTPMAIAEELGERLKQARLNQNLTQLDVSEIAGVTRHAVMQAEKGKVQLEIFVAILAALNLDAHLDLFLPKQLISPVQLAKLQGKQRQRASGQKVQDDEDMSSW